MKSSLLLLIIFFSAIHSPVLSQDMKIGFANPNEILSRMPEMRAVEQRLQNLQQRKQQEFLSKQQEIQMAFEQYEQRQGVISEEAQRAEEEQLSQLEAELIQLRNNIQQEIQAEYENLIIPLEQQMREAINVVAERRGFDYVLNTTTPSGDIIILHIREEIRNDYYITDEVMRELGI